MTTGSTERYHHTQEGLTLFALGMMLIGCVAPPLPFFHWPVTLVVALVALPTALILILRSQMTICISGSEMEINFLFDIIHKHYDLGQFVTVRVVRNKWYHGWGIRWWPGMAIYIVSGLNAVELTSPNGNVVRIGSDEPEALKQALLNAFLKESR